MKISGLLGMGIEIGAERRLRRERRLPRDVGKGRVGVRVGLQVQRDLVVDLADRLGQVGRGARVGRGAGVAVVVGVAVAVGASVVGDGVGVGVGSPFACGKTTIAVATPHNTAAAMKPSKPLRMIPLAMVTCLAPRFWDR